MLIELIKDHIGIDIFSKFDIDPHTFPAGFITNIGDTVNLFLFDHIRNLLDQAGFIDHIGKFCYHDAVFAVWHGFNIADSTNADLATASPIGLIDPCGAKHFCSRRKIRTLYNREHFFDHSLFVFDLIVDDLNHCINNLSQVVRGNVRRHTHGNSCGTIGQEIRITGRQYQRQMCIRDSS